MKRLLLCAGIALAPLGCGEPPAPHDHSEAHPEGHDHHAEGHGHGDEPVVRITLWSDEFELFAEHEAAVAGQPVRLLAHLTVLEGFRALEAGEVKLELDGPAPIRSVAAAPSRPGIYELRFTPRAAGTYRGRLVVAGRVSSAIEELEITVHPSEEAAHAETPQAREGFIELLKEQQWGVPFGTAFVAPGTIVPAIEVTGTVDTPPNGQAIVGAPVAGRLVAPPGGFPSPGAPVRRGQLLATLAPTPSSPEESARASLGVAEGEARVAAARTALGRAQRLFGDQAVSRRELEDAEREVAVSEEALRAARGASRIHAGAARGTGTGAFRIVAPIDGILAEVNATVGESVGPEASLFRIVDPSELWLRARVPERDASRLRGDSDAAFRIPGIDEWMPLDLTGEDANATLVSLGRTVDPATRTVEVLYALRTADPRLRVGGLVQMSLPAGEELEGLVVPRTAVVDDEGRTVVYVQVDGEHFEQRLVRTGPSSGERIGILSGVRAGERVVVEGAHLVRLADRPASSEPHGHVH